MASPYCRKEKSLGRLCTNFFKLYNREGVDTIGLDAAALQLGVERRRIYDIVNILEGIGVLQKKAKNQYTWKGFGAIPEALKVLKEQGLKEEFGTYVANVSNQKKYALPSDSKTEWQDKCSESDKSEHKRQKSLGLLTQNFVKLFLCSDMELISLDEAALALLWDGHDEKALRTKSRRLYDIANVFSSMKLIEKVCSEIGKSAYRWIDMESCGDGLSIAPDAKNTKRRAFGTEITNTLVKRCNTSSTDWKLIEKVNMGIHSKDNSKAVQEEVLTEQHQNYGTKDFVFGPFTPNVTKSEARENKNGGQNQDWQNLFRDYRPQYCNQAVNDLFHHYSEAWNSWYVEAKDKQQIEPGS
ncbi:hypothetical protein ABFS82_08G017100 [Erythranthe guttata]|uniref:E2F/DP family winged-helix DNA-binding domain-containing protein n=1 Tax=Erythranthe guttata TaxID=4155 RepID=A0A022RXH2_ERYGU|nr:PREDICTED: E2F transcription factor-like E2FF isoform X1 [Erythranthe guttata]EYU44681.1 hypothetical protein MIMGU_mgv1a009071mg [Erythranthe guttata]|eukprot:XP_012850942.1 PREDICTED: E2F transcription factor-like E2FF isoform X1 [Erythranthe guttata]